LITLHLSPVQKLKYAQRFGAKRERYDVSSSLYLVKERFIPALVVTDHDL